MKTIHFGKAATTSIMQMSDVTSSFSMRQATSDIICFSIPRGLFSHQFCWLIFLEIFYLHCTL